MDSEKSAVSLVLVKPHEYSKRVVLKTILCREDGGKGLVGERVVIGGWVKSSKEVKKELIVAQPARSSDAAEDQKGAGDVSCVELLQSRLPFFRCIMKVFGASNFPLRETVLHHKPAQPSISFLQVSDGSCVGSLQVLVSSSLAPPALVMPTGTCILVSGILRNPSMEGKHAIELMTEQIFHIGSVDHDRYPLSKKRLPVDALREFCHFRPRTTTVASIMRIRDSLGFATHVFFHNNGFISVDAPIITTTDCEGSSEKFHVTTTKTVVPRPNMRSETIRLEEVKAAVQEKTKRVEDLKRSESNKDALAAAIQDLGNMNELALHLESKEKEKTKLGSFLKAEKEASEAYFPGETFLTVSGRFHLESYASALGNVYSFGPRFRPARSNSSKQVAEMWMVEVEMAFSNLEDVIRCADDYLKFLCKSVLENCKDDMNFILKRIDKASIDRLQSMISTSFEKISYTEAVEVFEKQITEKTHHLKIEWGAALSEEHLSYLVEEVYKRPVIVYNHPKEAKPFYIRLNDDGKTVASFDVVVPKVGTLITGSLNEERIHRLDTRIKEMGLPRHDYEWYMDLRRHGTVMHSGFSFRFDLMVLFATGINDVKDVIPFPRSHGKANN